MARRSTATRTRRSSTAGSSGSSTATRPATQYPYSQRTTLGEVTTDALTVTTPERRWRSGRDQVNYIRNSVKATVDAYDGTVTLYEWDGNDPMLQTWMKALPRTRSSRRATISPELMQHVRYPEDLFKVQREILAQYHVHRPGGVLQRPGLLEGPERPDQAGRPRGAAAVLPARCRCPARAGVLLADDDVRARQARDAGGVHGGQLRARRRTTARSGCCSCRARRRSRGRRRCRTTSSPTPTVSSQLSLLRRGGSDVELGNLLTLPVAGGLLYVEPVYVRAAQGGVVPAAAEGARRRTATRSPSRTPSRRRSARCSAATGRRPRRRRIRARPPSRQPVAMRSPRRSPTHSRRSPIRRPRSRRGTSPPTARRSSGWPTRSRVRRPPPAARCRPRLRRPRRLRAPEASTGSDPLASGPWLSPWCPRPCAATTRPGWPATSLRG